MNKYSRIVRKLRTVKIAFLIVLFFSLQYSLEAQITIESSDMPSQGDTVRISTSLNLDMDYSETGENFDWDFSGLVAAYQTVDTFLSPMETPPIYQLFFALSSNLANRYLRDLPIPNFELTDIFYFYKNSGSKFTQTGYAASINGIPLPVKFDNPDVWYRFPLNYGNVDSSASRFEFNIPDMGYILVERSRRNTVDGWGTITTPFGTFDVLRVKSEVHEFDSLYIDSLQMGVPLNRTYTEYKWMAKGQKEPVLQITSDFAGGLVASYRDSLRTIFDAVEVHLFDQNSFSVYPNPVLKEFHVEFGLVKNTDVDISLFDVTGRQVYFLKINHAAKGPHNKLIDIRKAGLKSGTYLLEIRAGKQQLTGKIIVEN